MMPREDAGRDREPRNPQGRPGGPGRSFGAGIPAPEDEPADDIGPDLEGRAEPAPAAAPSRPGLRAALERALALGEARRTAGSSPAPRLERAAAAFRGPRAAGPLRAALERSEGDGVLVAARVYARRIHWAEDPAEVLADVAVTTAAGVPVIVLAPAAVLAWYRASLDALDPGGARLHLEEDEHLDGLRAIAARPQVTVDAPFPESGATGPSGPQAHLARLRSEAAAAPRADAPPGWFGAGVVAPPPAPLRLGAPVAGVARVGVEGPAPPGEQLLSLPADPVPAARAVVEAAFGPAVLGGHALSAVRRVVVERGIFSAFSAALLEELDDGLERGTLGPPAWALEPPARFTTGSDPALTAARRVGLDEGATLIHEERRPGRRLVVFTNVEPRMALGSALVAPCVLSLMRSE